MLSTRCADFRSFAELEGFTIDISVAYSWLSKTMAGKKKRKTKRVAQLARRKLARKERKLTADLDRLFALGPGGSALNPIAIPTPTLLKSNAEAMPCPLCLGKLRMIEESIDRDTEELLRIAHCKCDVCGSPRKMWFRLQLPRVN